VKQKQTKHIFNLLNGL